MQTVETENKQELIIHNSIEIFRTAPEILKGNQQRTQKAIAVGNDILDAWYSSWAIEDEDARFNALAAVDERSNKYLVNCGNAVKQEKEQRAAITQMMDVFKKMFTDAENDIDKTKPNTVPSKVQNNRDTYVQEAFKIQDRKRKEAEREAAKKKEAIELKASVEQRLSSYFNDRLLQGKQWLTKKFNDLKLDSFADEAADIRRYEPVYSTEHYNKFDAALYSSLFTKEELIDIIASVQTMAKYDALNDIYKKAMLELKAELVEKIPSKQAELKEQKRLADEAAAEADRQRLEKEKRDAQIASANTAEKKRLEAEAEETRKANEKRNAELKAQQDAAAAEQKQREEAEAEKLRIETEEAKRKEAQESEAKKQGDQTMVMFETEAAIADTAPAPETKLGFEISVLHPVGFTQIFAVWFEKEGKNLPVDKIGNTKLDQMKAFCEKIAHKDGFFIESKFLKYEESFKAVNRKAK